MKRKIISAAVIFLMLFQMYGVRASGQVAKFKAAFIFNFTRYIEWPSSYNPDAFVIGILGKDNELANELNMIASAKNVSGKPIRIENYSSINGIGSCNILYVCSSHTGQIGSALGHTGNKNILVVSDSPGSIGQGSAINFVFSNNKLGFEIKSSVARQKGLKVSSSLENLASRRY